MSCRGEWDNTENNYEVEAGPLERSQQGCKWDMDQLMDV
jgi:hypothetical protein